MTITLYGLPHSLYTAKVRAYLRKQGIAYREVPPAHPRFTAQIVPKIGRGIIPVVEFPDGELVQDTVDIIDRFEQEEVPLTAYPATPRQRAVAHLFEIYAVLSLTRHAMHYRWSYLAEQELFLRDAFGARLDPASAEAIMGRMQSYLPILGVDTSTIPAIEESYLELLGALDAHFAELPYLLGHQPSIGDYSLFGPLFAHLGRDPVPLGIMQRTAPRVFRWCERMHAGDLDMVEYPEATAGYLADDAVPDTLSPILRQIAAEIVPGLIDRLGVLQAHVAAGGAIPGEPVTAKPSQRVIGFAQTSFRGVPYKGGVQPYLFLLWQRLLDSVGNDAEARPLFARHGLSPVLEARLPIRVERRDYREVWGEVQSGAEPAARPDGGAV